MTRPCPKHDKCVHRLGKGHTGRCLEYDEVTQKRSWIMLDDPGWNETGNIRMPNARPLIVPPTASPSVTRLGSHHDAGSSIANGDPEPTQLDQMACAQGSDLCVVCEDDQRTHMVFPCGHRCMCKTCAFRIGDTCPMCRAPKQGICEVFL